MLLALVVVTGILGGQSFVPILAVVLAVKLCMSANHFIQILLILEVFNLLFFFSATSGFFLGLPSAYALFMVFTLMVCEASTGLGVLILLSRFKGGQLVSF